MKNTDIENQKIIIEISLTFIGNLSPLLGLFFFDWTLSDVALLLFFEAIVMGFINILKIIYANPTNNSLSDKIIMVFAFLFLHGTILTMYWGLMFIYVAIFRIIDIYPKKGVITRLQTQKWGEPTMTPFIDYLYEVINYQNLLLYAHIFIIFRYVYIFIKDYLRGNEWKKTEVINLTYAPYKAIAIQQFTLIIGLIVVATLRNS